MFKTLKNFGTQYKNLNDSIESAKNSLKDITKVLAEKMQPQLNVGPSVATHTITATPQTGNTTPGDNEKRTFAGLNAGFLDPKKTVRK